MSHLYQSVLTADNKASRSGNRYCKSQKIPKGPVTNRSIKKITDFMSCVSKVSGLREGKEAERRKRGKKGGGQRKTDAGEERVMKKCVSP